MGIHEGRTALVPLHVVDESFDERIIGREAPLSALTTVLRAGAKGGAVAAVTGDPGAGRTALLDAVADAARALGMRIVRLAGFEDEASLPYATLTTLITELEESLGSVPAHQRHELDVVRAHRRGARENTMAACAGTLSLLRSASAQQAVSLLVDDVQWIDEESARALRFVAHRLAGSHVAMIVAARREPGVPMIGLPVEPIVLDGLDAADCRRLAASVGQELTDAQASALHAATGGNPLAVRWCLGSPEGDPPPDPLDRLAADLPHSFERTWGRAWAEFDEATRIALGVVARSRRSDEDSVVATLRRLGLTRGALDPAEQRGVLVRRHGMLLLGPPLFHCLVRARTPDVTRRAAEIPAAPRALPPEAPADRGRPARATLTPQEARVMRAMSEGMSNAEIARAMFLSPKTVEAHLTRVYRKLGLRSRTELVRFALTLEPDVAS